MMKRPQKETQSGFTLIESLVAIVVISITVVAITPPIFWATATRVQNRRAEQALALAQGEIDRVRATIERGGTPTLEELPASVGATSTLKTYPGPAPSSAWDKVRSVVPADNTAEDVTRDANGKPLASIFPPANSYAKVYTNPYTGTPSPTPDFLVQVFRDDGICDGENGACVAPNNVPRIFSVTVRVYAGIATRSSLATLEREKARLTGGTGTGQAGFRPLAVLTSEVSRSVNSDTLGKYQQKSP